MLNKAKGLCMLLAASAVMSLPSVVQATSSYPNKPIRLVVPFAPGGSNDMVARIVGPKVADVLGTSVVIENKAGAGGAVGAMYAAQAPNDGYTILLHSTTVTMQPWLLKDPGYDVFRDFDPVTRVSSTPFTLVVSSPLEVNSYKELAEYTKDRKGDLFFGSAGTGSSPHLVGEYFKSQSDVDMQHVPYKGNGPMMVALMGNEIQVGFDTIQSSKPMAESGRVKIIAVTSQERNENIPDVPTLHESGLPDFDVGVWQGIFMPKGADPQIIDKVQKAFAEALKDQEVVQKLSAAGFSVVASTPEEFVEKIKADMEVWSRVTKDIGYKPE